MADYQIPLGNNRFALVDEEDFIRLKRYRYYAKKCRDKYYPARCGSSGPVTRNGQRSFVPLAHDVLNVRPGTRIKYVNGNSLDCRKANLKVEAGQVYRMKHVERKAFMGRIRVDGERHFLGTWPSAQWAQRACQIGSEVAKELRGRGLARSHVRRELRIAVGLDA